MRGPSIGVDPLGYSNKTLDGCPPWENDCSGKNDLQCDSYEVTGQCNGTYWWYSANHNSAYTLNNNDDTDSTDILAKIFRSGWSTGSLLFENAAICNIRNMLNQSIPELNYTTSQGIAGFAIQGNIPNELRGYTQTINTTTTFLPMNGAGLSHLSTISAFANALFHPTDSLWAFNGGGLDFSCTSQLNVSVANSWGSPWTENSPKSRAAFSDQGICDEFDRIVQLVKRPSPVKWAKLRVGTSSGNGRRAKAI